MVVEKSKLSEWLNGCSQVAGCKVTVYFKKSIANSVPRRNKRGHNDGLCQRKTVVN